jgi:hypothetical protein
LGALDGDPRADIGLFAGHEDPVEAKVSGNLDSLREGSRGQALTPRSGSDAVADVPASVEKKWRQLVADLQEPDELVIAHHPERSCAHGTVCHCNVMVGRQLSNQF